MFIVVFWFGIQLKIYQLSFLLYLFFVLAYHDEIYVDCLRTLIVFILLLAALNCKPHEMVLKNLMLAALDNSHA